MADSKNFKTDRQKVKELTEEHMEKTIRNLQKGWESEGVLGEDDLVFKVSFLGEEVERYYLVDNVWRMDFLRLLHDYADTKKDGGLYPESYLLEHGVHLYLWKDFGKCGEK